VVLLHDHFSAISLTDPTIPQCIKGSALAFVCPYSNGFKYKTDVENVFTYVDRTCGLSIMGYAQIGGGQGDMTAGRCKSDDHFCTKDFHAGN
jgi:hypothetical protein